MASGECALISLIFLVVDSTTGHRRLSFMDDYSRYNQIWMSQKDQEKTSFITDHRQYCYQVMPIELKNAGVTYQRLVNCMFKHQIGRNMEVYIDDLLIKSMESEHHIADLWEVFVVLH